MNKIYEHHKILTKLTTGDKYLTPPKFHSEIIDIYSNKDRLQLVTCPVGFAKSSTIKSFGICQLLRPKNHDKFILYVSSTATKVAGQFTGLSKILNNSDIQIFYSYKVVESNQSTITIEMSNGERRRISGVASGQDISGINFENARPSLILVDDLEELDSAKSIYLTEKTIEWLNTTLISRLPSLSSGRIRMIGTNLTKNSIVNRIINNLLDQNGSKPFQNWKWYKYQALDQDNKSIWEDVHPTISLLKEQEVNPYTFASNYMNEPLDISSGMVKMEYLRFFEETKPITEAYIHIDTTHTGKQTSDYFCCGIIGKCTDNYYNVLDFHLQKCDPETQARIVIAFYQKWKHLPIKKMTFDAVSNDGFGYWIKKLAREEYNIALPIEAIKMTKDKVSHLTPHLPLFISNSVRLPNNHGQLQLAMDQLLTFPQSGVHDDFVDMLSGCLDGFVKTQSKLLIVEFF